MVLKRFWTTVDLVREGASEEDGWAIQLDSRPVRTPARAPLVVPGEPLARRIAAEWIDQGEAIDPRSMPMTGFANATIDRVLPALGDFRGQVAAYAESDLLCYRADHPEALVALQRAEWDPLLDWAQASLGARFVTTTGILPIDQPARTLATLRGAVEALDPWLLAGVATLVQIGGTLIGALALLGRAIDAEALFEAASLDERWQAQQWGEDAEAAERLTLRRAEFLQAANYVALIGGR